MEFSQAVKTCFKKKYFTISGRASRSEFWWFQVFLFGGSILLLMVAALLIGATGASEGPTMVVVLAISVFYLSLVIPSITATVRRFHDIDMSGWWGLGFLILNVIPYLGIISVLVMLYLLAKKGTSGDNRFGWDPVGNTQSADTVSTVIPADTSNPTYLIKNEAVLSDGGPKTATTNLNSSSMQHEPSLAQTAEPADEEMYETALNELDTDTAVSAIYAKALALSKGDMDNARWKYVDLRVAKLKDQEAKGANLVSCKDCGVREPSERLTDGLCLDCIGFRAARLEAEEALEKLKAKLQPCKVCGVNELSETLSDGVCLECRRDRFLRLQ